MTQTRSRARGALGLSSASAAGALSPSAELARSKAAGLRDEARLDGAAGPALAPSVLSVVEGRLRKRRHLELVLAASALLASPLPGPPPPPPPPGPPPRRRPGAAAPGAGNPLGHPARSAPRAGPDDRHHTFAV